MNIKTTKKILRIIFRVLLVILVLIVVTFLIITGPYWWKHWFTYPRLEKERAELWIKYKKPEKYIQLNDFKGVLHVHSY